MPYDRRIIFGTHVTATRIDDAENTDINHTENMTNHLGGTVIETLGGKGIAEIANSQWGDAWTSFTTISSSFEWTNVGQWTAQSNTWNSGSGDTMSSTVTISTTPSRISRDVNDLAFLYIKNTGVTNTIQLSLNGSSGSYDLEIPPRASINLRGGHTNLNCDSVFLKSSADTTTIEYVMAV